MQRGSCECNVVLRNATTLDIVSSPHQVDVDCECEHIYDMNRLPQYMRTLRVWVKPSSLYVVIIITIIIVIIIIVLIIVTFIIYQMLFQSVSSYAASCHLAFSTTQLHTYFHGAHRLVPCDWVAARTLTVAVAKASLSSKSSDHRA